MDMVKVKFFYKNRMGQKWSLQEKLKIVNLFCYKIKEKL